MKNRHSLLHGQGAPANILEVRFDPAVWRKVQAAAAYRQTTYSWVVRYCVFRLVKRRHAAAYLSSRSNPEAERRACEQRGGESHRHRLCLYGQDELYLRITAARLQYTLSHLIRLAVEIYLATLLPYIKPTRFSAAAFYWLGIKIFRRERRAGGDFPPGPPRGFDLSLERYPKSAYW